MLLEAMQVLITVCDPSRNRGFYDAGGFPWVDLMEKNWRVIRAELDAVLAHRDEIPNFQDLSEEQRVLTKNDEWKAFVLFVYGNRAEENCRRCPQTTSLLSGIPGMKSAMFSILAPGKHIPEHRGPYKGVLRYHLGLIIPSPGSCRIRVKNEIREWQEGSSLIFDDSHPHEVWNDAASHRVVLFVDFMRPLVFPLSVLNRMMIWRLSGRPFFKSILDRARAFAQNAPQPSQ